MLFGLFSIMPFMVCLFWTMVLLLDWRRNNPAQHVLAVFMAMCTMLYLCHAAFFHHEAALTDVTESVYAFCNVGVFPLYYLYICRLTALKGLSLRNMAFLIPALVIGLWTTGLNIFIPGDVAADRLRMTVMRIVFMVQLVPISWICYRKLMAFDREISNRYADTEGRSVRPTGRMMSLLIGGALISGIANFLGREYFDSEELLICVPSVLFSMLLFGVGYVGTRQEFCIDDLVRDEKNSTSNEGVPEGLTAGVDDASSALQENSQFIAALDRLMQESRIFLRPDLRLSEVAKQLGVGRTTLSQRINQELQLSFSDYINNLRVDFACTLLSDPGNDKMSLTGVAEMSGFSSDSSFYRAFRRRTGKTPKQFLADLNLTQ